MTLEQEILFNLKHLKKVIEDDIELMELSKSKTPPDFIIDVDLSDCPSEIFSIKRRDFMRLGGWTMTKDGPLRESID